MNRLILVTRRTLHRFVFATGEALAPRLRPWRARAAAAMTVTDPAQQRARHAPPSAPLSTTLPDSSARIKNAYEYRTPRPFGLNKNWREKS